MIPQNVKNGNATEIQDTLPTPENKHNQKTFSLTSFKPLKKDTSMPDLLAIKDQTYQRPDNLIKESKIKKEYWKDDLTFRPKINDRSHRMKVSGGTISDALYQDAIRRKHKSVEMAKIRPDRNLKYLSEKSAKLLALKLIKEFEEKANEYFGDNEHKFMYSEMCEFLKMLHFIKASENENTTYAQHEKSLQQDLWLVLKGEKFKGVNERNLLVFLLAIMGLDFLIPGYVKVNSNDIEQLFEHNKFPEDKFNGDNTNSTENTIVKFDGMRVKLEDIREYEKGNLGMKSRSYGSFEGLFIKPPSAIKNNNQHSLSPQKSNHNIVDSKVDNAEGNLNTVNRGKLLNIQDKKRQLNSFYAEYSKGIREQNKFGLFDEKQNITFNSKEIQMIAKAYDIFYFNRLHSMQNIKKFNDIDNSFQPDILSESRNLATGYREKQLQQAAKYFEETRTPIPSNGKLTHADLLFYQRLAQKNKIKRVQTTKEKEIEICTFKPKVNSYMRTSSSIYRDRFKAEHVANCGKASSKPLDEDKKIPFTYLGNKRTDELYSLAKLGTKVDKTANEHDFEKNFTECTFSPDLIASKMTKRARKEPNDKTSGSNNNEKCKNFEKSVDRLKKGREVREFMNYYNERCFPFIDTEKNSMKFDIQKPNIKAGFDAFTKNENLNNLKLSNSNKPNKAETFTSEHGYINLYNGDNSFTANRKIKKEDNGLLLWNNGNINNNSRSKNQNLPLSGNFSSILLNKNNRAFKPRK